MTCWKAGSLDSHREAARKQETGPVFRAIDSEVCHKRARESPESETTCNFAAGADDDALLQTSGYAGMRKAGDHVTIIDGIVGHDNAMGHEAAQISSNISFPVMRRFSIVRKGCLILYLEVL